jgi:septum formation protein
LGVILFDIAAAEIDETPYPDENARAYVLRMAESKAKAVLNSLNHDRIVYVLGADTTVVDGEEILGKPENEADATSHVNSFTRSYPPGIDIHCYHTKQ